MLVLVAIMHEHIGPFLTVIVYSMKVLFQEKLICTKKRGNGAKFIDSTGVSGVLWL